MMPHLQLMGGCLDGHVLIERSFQCHDNLPPSKLWSISHAQTCADAWSMLLVSPFCCSEMVKPAIWLLQGTQTSHFAFFCTKVSNWLSLLMSKLSGIEFW